jgi:hypothetical protein
MGHRPLSKPKTAGNDQLRPGGKVMLHASDADLVMSAGQKQRIQIEFDRVDG